MNRDAPSSASPRPGDTIGRNAVFAFATQMVTAAFTAALTVYLVRALGPAEFGVFALGLGITGLLQRPSSAGTEHASARYVAERHGDTAGITAVLGMALPIRLLTATAISAALFAFAGPIADAYNAPDLAWTLRWMAIAFFGHGITGFMRTMFVSLRRTDRGFTLIFSESAVEFTATVAFVALAGGVAAAALGRAVGYAFGAAFGLFLLTRLLGRSPLFRTGRSPVRRREFMSYAWAMLIVTGAGAIFSQVDVLLIGAFLSTSAVGIFGAPLRLIAFVGYPAMALAQGVAPRLARHRDEPPNVAALERAIGYVVVLQAGLVAFLTLWADPIVRLALGSEFSESAEVLRALAPFIFLQGLNSMLSSPLNYAGEGRRRIPITIAAIIVNVVLDVILLPTIGVLGAAVGTDVAYSVYAGAHLWLCYRLFDLPLRPLAATTARALVAAGAMAVVLALIGTGSLSPVQWLVGLILAPAAFVATLVATRELSVAEIQALANAPIKALRRR
jgi:O-antigen/teichoic acid export membrane protein